MGAKFAGGLLLLVITTSILSIAMASRPTTCTHWANATGSGCLCGGDGAPAGKNDTQPPPPPAGKNDTQPHRGSKDSKRIIVNWNSSFVYESWAADTPTIYQNDTIVFRYPRKSGYNVYLMPDAVSYLTCKFDTGAIQIANTSDGRGHHGFSYTLSSFPSNGFSRSFPFYYFASNPQCAQGVKLQVIPVPRNVGKN